MKIAVTAMGSEMTDEVSSRFGRAPYFIIVETDGMTLIEAIENPNVSAGGGAGVQSGQILADKDVATILTGNCGPKAFQVFEAAGIEIFNGASGCVKDAIAEFQSGKLQEASQPNVPSHHGI